MRNDEEAGYLCSCQSRNISVHTACRAVISRLLQRHGTIFHKETDIALISDKCRHSKTGLHYLKRFQHQFFRCVLMDAHRHRMMRQMRIQCRIKQQIRQIVRRIASVLFLSADCPVVPLCHSCIFGTVCFSRYTVDLHDLAAHDFQQLQHIVSREYPSLDVLLVIRIHILVKSSGC